MNLQNILQDALLNDIKRTLNVISLQYKKGENIYCLHCQCLVRFLYKESLVASSYDIYYQASEEDDDTWDWSESPGESLFDRQIEQVVKPLLPQRVIQVKSSRSNDIKIVLENDLCLEITVISVSGNEEWRLFKQGDYENNTYIVYGNDVERIGFKEFQRKTCSD
jgi:hypothetical protein